MQLLIKGIRSFSPDNKTSIDFYRPLTLIVGQNGAGKTVRPLRRDSRGLFFSPVCSGPTATRRLPRQTWWMPHCLRILRCGGLTPSSGANTPVPHAARPQSLQASA